MDDLKPPVIDHVEKDHERMKVLMAAVLDDTQSPEPPRHFLPWQLALLRRLRDFQHVLLNHFDLEEIGGFMEDLRERTPHLMHRIDQIEAEHDRILERLEAVIDAVKDMPRFIPEQVEEAFAQTREIVVMLKQHEAVECDLLQEAYYQDVGVKD